MKLDVKNQYWMGEIPDSWETKKIKFVLSQRNENNVHIKSTEILSLTAKQGVIPYSEKEGGGNKPKQDFSAYKLTYPGDIVMNSMNILSGAVGLSKYMGCISPVYYALKPKNKTDDVRFFYYVFANKTFQNSLLGLGNGILIKQSDNGNFNTIRMRIPIEKLNNLSVPYPSPSIQKQIADFLDRKTTEIDGLIDNINAEIDTIQQYQRSVITRAVTKGFDPSVPMKDSGIEWIGEIPETWKLVAAKRCIILENGSEPKTDSGDTPVYGSGSQSFRTCQEFKLGPTVLLGRKGTIDRPQWIEGKFWNIDTALNVRSKGINLKYYYYCSICFDYEWYVTQTAKPSMTQTDYYNMQIPLPVKAEQQQIVDYLDQKVAQIQKLIKSKQQQITKLTEYKNSLIFEYVTGKKQVKEAN